MPPALYHASRTIAACALLAAFAVLPSNGQTATPSASESCRSCIYGSGYWIQYDDFTRVGYCASIPTNIPPDATAYDSFDDCSQQDWGVTGVIASNTYDSSTECIGTPLATREAICDNTCRLLPDDYTISTSVEIWYICYFIDDATLDPDDGEFRYNFDAFDAAGCTSESFTGGEIDRCPTTTASSCTPIAFTSESFAFSCSHGSGGVSAGAAAVIAVAVVVCCAFTACVGLFLCVTTQAANQQGGSSTAPAEVEAPTAAAVSSAKDKKEEKAMALSTGSADVSTKSSDSEKPPAYDDVVL